MNLLARLLSRFTHRRCDPFTGYRPTVPGHVENPVRIWYYDDAPEPTGNASRYDWSEPGSYTW